MQRERLGSILTWFRKIGGSLYVSRLVSESVAGWMVESGQADRLKVHTVIHRLISGLDLHTVMIQLQLLHSSRD